MNNAAEVAKLNAQIASYTALVDEAIAEGDDEGAEAMLEALNRACDKLDALSH